MYLYEFWSLRVYNDFDRLIEIKRIHFYVRTLSDVYFRLSCDFTMRCPTLKSIRRPVVQCIGVVIATIMVRWTREIKR